ncbi:hypothetical protein EMIT0P218_10053 [Pseudomonas sp. IT-P218]
MHILLQNEPARSTPLHQQKNEPIQVIRSGCGLLASHRWHWSHLHLLTLLALVARSPARLAKTLVLKDGFPNTKNTVNVIITTK